MEQERTGIVSLIEQTPAQTQAPLTKFSPFTSWTDFEEQARQFFLTMETRDDAIHQIQMLNQGKRNVEDYIIDFRGLAQLTGYNDIALIAQFRRGLNPQLGLKIVENGAPGDGTTTGDLENWYKKVNELNKAWRDAKKFYGVNPGQGWQQQCASTMSMQGAQNRAAPTPVTQSSGAT